ncbi:Dynein heavy chain 17, axonemal [Hondaea fermentalgiana]|uniref:Dynein heavy chain 17, axonemal n=1 Tax=Hondaea fermentalgiana TaxID=2315210 RepID=A0A2R5G8S1_9STRA|nr:Dynein heavy chain 17, axonemal [Hondaea fermentalgiana]|eukprot:GBG27447.1 Dynein heavy chain 17, axonemal [Hondaea fermentalgiana]
MDSRSATEVPETADEMESKHMRHDEGVDPRSKWLEQRVQGALRHVKAEKLRKSFRSDENARAIVDFFKSPESRCLLVLGDGATFTTAMPSKLQSNAGKILYFLKQGAHELSETCDMDAEVSMGELSSEPLAHMEKAIQCVYMPLLAGATGAQEGSWGDVTSKDIVDKLHGFLATVSITLGQTQGETCLPLPLTETGASASGSSHVPTPSKDKIHLLEGAVITWTKQIKNVLKMDPESRLKVGANPTPDQEIAFWRTKAANLNSIFTQLQSDRIRKVLRVLDSSKSTYCNPFAKLCKEVFSARIEANDNVRYLAMLEPWVNKLQQRNGEFQDLVAHFKPVMHTILLIWKYSDHYNTPARLVVLMREICNALIAQSCDFVSGDQIFELIEADEATKAVEKLKVTLKVCGTFKSTYFDYKATANTECPNNPWRIQNNALFLRLDSFLERCHDILDLTQTIVQFNMLSRIEIGGTKGKALTTSVVQIYADFRHAVEAFQQVNYDIMDVSAKEFDDDFYDFRCKIKELERRLGSILTQSFDDAATINARFKLLDSFEGLLERPIIQDELEKKHISLVQAYAADLKLVQETFLELKDDPPIPSNMPPAAGAIGWCLGLLDRITEPMEKLRQLNRTIMDREEAKDVMKIHQGVVETFNKYCKSKAQQWAACVDETAAAKLKLPLLRHRDMEAMLAAAAAAVDSSALEHAGSKEGSTEAESEASKASASASASAAAHIEQIRQHQKQVEAHGGFTYKLLEVNFDPQLIALLREVKYFLLLKLDVPGFALELNKKEKQFRNWRGKLQLCVNKYNSMMTSILPVECPLVRAQVEKIHSVVQTGLSMLTWKSHGIDGFIEKTEMAVSEAETTLSVLKSNLAEIEDILDSWSETSILDRQPKPETVKEYNQLHTTRIGARYQQITEGGKNIHRLLKESNKTLRISAGHPEWRSYVDFVNNVVVGGFTRVVQVSLQWLEDQVDPAVIEEKEKPPMLQISINLNNNQVSFIPSVFDEDRAGVKASLRSWIDDTLKAGSLMKRLDMGEGSYVKELQQDVEVKARMEAISAHVSRNEERCREFQKQYEKYSFLWSTDLQAMFADFIASATSQSDNGLRRIDLGKFDAEMNRLNDIKEEVASLKTPTNIGWLKIDSTPIKENIVYWVQKWLHLYTGYLRDDVISKLQSLRIFIIETRRGLEREVSAGDTDTLMSVMGNIRDVRCRMDDTIEMLQPLKDTVNLLKQHRVDIDDEVLHGPPPVEDGATPGSPGQASPTSPGSAHAPSSEPLLEFLDAASLKWDSLVNFTFRVKEQIMPLQNQEVEFINASLQKFRGHVEEFRELFKDEKKGAPFAFRGSIDDAYALISKFRGLYEEKRERAEELNRLEELFELQTSKYRTLAQTEAELDVLKNLWDFKAMQASTYESWNSTQWKKIDTDELERLNSDLSKGLKALGAKDPMCRAWQVYQDIEQACKDMAVILPLVAELHSPAMRARHWKAIAAACKVPSIAWNSEAFNFAAVLQLELQKHALDVSEQVETAVKELKIERKLETIESRWETLRLDFIDQAGNLASEVANPYVVYLPRPSDDVVENLETDQLELQTMIGMGKFVKYFKDRVSKWLHTLSDIEANLKDWLNVSKQWCSLESIFLGSADIRSRLPEDTKRFEAVDHEFKELEARAFSESPLVVHRCTEEGLSAALRRMLVDLAKCQKSLNEYLDTKKKVYPRFYFVSNMALLDILSNGDAPKRVVPYLADCYDALADLKFKDEHAENPHVATHMIAGDGETIEFPYSFEMKDSVEHWLNKLTDMQNLTLKTVLRAAIDTAVNWEHEKPRHEWLFDYPAQVVLQACQVFWTEETEAALEDLEAGGEDAVKQYLEKCNERLNRLIKLVEGDMSKSDRTKVISLITMDVHARDVVHKLIDEKAESPASFLWQQQLRNYWKTVNPNMETDIRICDFKTKYSYEYVGNCGRLVITPLTDRCYITLTTAMRLMLGGAPAGPAGTGKTETTKDLARALALPCYVFNCSDQMNYQTLADIFKGLSQSGAWGCFDEFNRIPIEVLSVVATQVKTVLDAVVRFAEPANRPEDLVSRYGELGLTPGTPPCKVGYFDFFGDDLCLVPTTGFFITMNPGYAGRTELPENLKALFRSCAMIRPDLALICENMLMSEGFQKARALSVKFVTLYQLSSELLSPQAHYDWGLRAVKSVLRVAGVLKRSNPGMEEEAVLMRALRDFNTPKIVAHDMDIFLRLIADLFPQYAESTPKVINEVLKDTTKTVCRQSSPPLQSDEAFVAKVVQFQELLDVRHSVMLIGCAGSGKTTIWRTLLQCHNHLGKQRTGTDKKVAVAETINPKAVTSDELYGFMSLSKDWKDGVLSIIMRGMSKNYRDLGYHAYQTSKWIVLDGDIDAVWIESMNTVMDDNKVLTLVSNERIPLSDSMRMVFEINSLKNATPATVSRAGILYINETDIGWRPFVESWLTTLPNEMAKDLIPQFFDKYVERITDFMKEHKLRSIVPTYTISAIQTICSLVHAQIGPWAATPAVASGGGVTGNGAQYLLEQIFAYACVWGFGGSLAAEKGSDAKALFSMLFVQAFPGIIPVDDASTVFDYFIDTTMLGQPDEAWRHWREHVEDFVPPSLIGSGPGQTPFSALYVDTVDNVRTSRLVDMLSAHNKPVMLVGGAGTGKSVIVQNWMRELVANNENMLSTLISMNYFTDSAAFQRQIEGSIDKRSGHRFGPAGNKKLVFFIDDLNLPFVEEYGTQNALSLLRQILSYGTFFDRHDPGFRKEIVDVRFVSAMNPYAGNFTVSERVQRYFTTLACSMPSQEDLNTIFLSILDGHLQSFPPSVEAMLSTLVQATISLHTRVAEKFLPSAVRFVYNWNMREYANVFQGICRSKAEVVSTPVDMCRLWVHECRRVYSDRLIDETDRSRFNDILVDVSKSFALEDVEDLHKEPLLYTNFGLTGDGGGEDDPYAGVESFAQLTKMMQGRLEDYNEVFPTMDLVLFGDAVRHVTRIARIIQCAGGSALLIGVGGSGKQSLSRLAAFMSGYQVKQMSAAPDFTTPMLLEQLQELFKATGLKGIPTAWIVSDAQIVSEEFLVYINDVLSNGWIPDLFSKEELPGILDGLKNELRASGLSDTQQDKIALFVRRIKKYLHVVLCFSPVGETLRVRARRFPGLVNNTVIDWFHPWPEEALVSVALNFIRDVDFPNQETRENVAYHMATVHLEVVKASTQYLTAARRFNYVTPKSFLEFISFYKKLLGEQREHAHGQVERLQNGLDVLRRTSVKVADLQEDLKVTLANVEEKKAASEILMEQIGVQRADAEKKQEIAAAEQAKAEEATRIAKEIQESANKELAEATPAMEAAAKAVDCLDKKALTELKSLSKPPAGVDEVTKACLMMIEGEFKNFKWDRAKKMMSNIDQFLNALKDFDAQNMDETLVSKLQPIVEMPIFTYDQMVKKSFAAANLCNWVTNIYRYNRIYVKVKPLMDKLEEAKRDKADAEAELAEVQRVVREVEHRLDDLKQTFLQATQEKMEVEEVASQCMAKLDLANRLVNGLASENERWAVEVSKLRIAEEQLIGNVLVSSAFVGYIGSFDASFREKLWRNEWVRDLAERELPCGEADSIDPLALLSSDSEKIQMTDEGLPADRISLENGAIITSCTRWPLIIDPQEQGIKWLKRRYSRRASEVAALAAKNQVEMQTPQQIKHMLETQRTERSLFSSFSGEEKHGEDASDAANADADVNAGGGATAEDTGSHADDKEEDVGAQPDEWVLPRITQVTKKGWEEDIVQAIEQGEVVLLENLGEDIDATLDPVLSRSITRKGRNQFIQFAGRELEYDDNFRLFLFTKLSNPHYKPEIQAQCTLINFIATEKGLEDQLLVRVVQAERPDKEAEQQRLQSDFNQFRIKLTSLEDALLQKLSNAPEDILSDVKLIEGLEATKAEAEKINDAVKSGEKVLQEIGKIRDAYRPVATEASMLYVLLTSLSSVNHMYQYSLEAFTHFFNKAIATAPFPGSSSGSNAGDELLSPDGLVNPAADLAGGEADTEGASEGSSSARGSVPPILDEKAVKQRVSNLQATLRFTIYKFVSRGLFESHKQLFLAQLTFLLMQRGQLESSSDWDAAAFDYLLRVPKDDMEENPLDDWLPDASWQAVQSLSKLDDFMNLSNDLVEAAPRFRDWVSHSHPETEKLPLDWAHLDRTPFLKLLVIRALRPDRMTFAVNNFVRSCLPDGAKFSDCDSALNSFDLLCEAFVDASPEVPLYFILSPGTDVLADLDRLAMEHGKEKGKSYHNVSLGQGQDKVAEELLGTAHREGHWVVLANVHLMPRWLPQLEKLLDQFKEANSEGHPDFRLFLSSDPSNRIPIGILARSIKLTNEAPTGLKANLKKAFLSFPRAFVEEADGKTKAILFGLCYFHAVMSERKKFGSSGFNMVYPFNLGDLRDSAICVTSTMDNNATAGTPWEDIRYLVGEILYGGHIVNDFDRLLSITFLKHILRDDLLDEMELYPFAEGTGESFKAPVPTTVERYIEYVEENIRGETPVAYGMHPNAEIEFRTAQSDNLFGLLSALRSDGVSTDGESAVSPQLAAEATTNDILDRFGDTQLDLEAVADIVEEKGPYQNTFWQECEAINTLLLEMRRSLNELTSGFAGDLTISDEMEALMTALHQGAVPASWARLAWPSTRTLPLWLSDLSNRIAQLQSWTESPLEIPRVTWLPGLVYPQALLTAIRQDVASKTGTELDKLISYTEPSKKSLEECTEAPPRDGIWVSGLSLQGARWNTSDSTLESSRPKELFSALPVINVRAVRADKAETGQVYMCPAYSTTARGPTYVFSAQLKTKAPAAKWILAGVAIILDTGA